MEKTKNTIYTEKEALYREIASLERNVKFLVEKQQEKEIQSGEVSNKNEITKRVYLETYEKVKELANRILIKYSRRNNSKRKTCQSFIYYRTKRRSRTRNRRTFKY